MLFILTISSSVILTVSLILVLSLTRDGFFVIFLYCQYRTMVYLIYAVTTPWRCCSCFMHLFVRDSNTEGATQ